MVLEVTESRRSTDAHAYAREGRAISCPADDLKEPPPSWRRI